MNKRRYKEWFRQAWHPSDEELLQYSDGELSTKEMARVRQHLDSCWSCRAQREEMERSIVEFTNYRKTTLTPPRETLPRAQSQFKARLSHMASESASPRGMHRFLNWIRKETLHSRSAVRFVTCLLVSLVLILFWIRLSSVQPVSAKEMLQRVETAESKRIQQVASPVIYQKVEVRRMLQYPGDNQLVTWEIWNDPGNKNFMQRVADSRGARLIRAKGAPDFHGRDESDGAAIPQVLTDLDQILQANQMDRQHPLSSAGYASWRHTLGEKEEEVAETRLPSGGQGLRLITSSLGPHPAKSIVRAELVIRTKDWHAVGQHLRAQGNKGIEDYEIAETAFQVIALNQLSASVLADLTPLSSRAAAPPPVVTPPPALSPPAADSKTAEIEARYALHRLRACLGEPVEVVLDRDGRILVQGLAKTPERKTELIAALQDIPLVRVNIQTISEAEQVKSRTQRVTVGSLGKPRVSRPNQQEAVIRTGKLPLQEKLERYLSKNDHGTMAGREQLEKSPDSTASRIAALSNQALSLSEAVMAEAWALRRLAEQYPSAKASDLRPLVKWRVEDMVKDHVEGMRAQLGGLRELLMPVLTSIVEESAGQGSDPFRSLSPSSTLLDRGVDSNWNTTSLELFEQVEKLSDHVRNLFTGSETLDDTADAASDELLGLLRQSEGWFQSLGSRLARDFHSLQAPSR
jgi:anti-sigma factor RsiW